MMRRLLLALAVNLAACLFLTGTAQAQSCTFSATNVVFGSVDTLGGGATNTVGTITAQCSSFVGLV